MPEAEEIGAFQADIDAIDGAIADLLAKRFQRSRRIGEIKRALGLPSSDPERIRAQRARFVVMCEGHGLSGAMAESMINTIVDQVLKERAQEARPSSDG